MEQKAPKWPLIAIAIIAVLGLFMPLKDVSFGATGTRYPNGISADSTSPSAGQVRGTTLTITGASTQAAATLSGLLTLDAGQLRSYTNSTTTPASMTLKLSDLQGYDTVLMNPTIGAITVTLFASSTASTWLPAAGDMQETCIVNATTTAAATITFAAGTGFDLETASSTPSDLALVGGNTACFKFIRQPATASAFDITAAMTEFNNGD